MYLPSISRDQEYRFHLNIAPVLQVDPFLAGCPDWTDVTKLPKQAKEYGAHVSNGLSKMENPLQKPGFIEAWNRAWPISEAIAEFLSDTYEPVSSGEIDRYSYLPGSSTNRVVVYENDTILYSHHASDPVQGAANCFDLVRIHKFGDLDDDIHGNTKVAVLPSFVAMSDLADKDSRVKAELFAEMDDLLDDLGESNDSFLPGAGKCSKSSDDNHDSKKTEDRSWRNDLELTLSGSVRRTRHNAMTIITCDPRIAPFVGKNELTGAPAALDRFRFPKVKFTQPPFDSGPRRWTDTDDAALAWVLAAPAHQKSYGLTFQKQELQYALLQAAAKNLSILFWTGSMKSHGTASGALRPSSSTGWALPTMHITVNLQLSGL